VRPSHLAVREVAAGNAPDAAIGEINFSDVARSVWKFANDAVHLEGMVYLHARSETAFVHDSLREVAVTAIPRDDFIDVLNNATTLKRWFVGYGLTT
jgi:hypothetical protein